MKTELVGGCTLQSTKEGEEGRGRREGGGEEEGGGERNSLGVDPRNILVLN